jgi:hypothetical protein
VLTQTAIAFPSHDVPADVPLTVATDDDVIHANYAQPAFALLPGITPGYDIAAGHVGLLHCPGNRFNEAAFAVESLWSIA